MNNKFTEGCKQLKDGRFQLYEDITINQNTIVEKKDRVEQLTESINGKEVPVYGTYTVKLWNVNPNNKNKNGRNYSKVVNQVIRENKVTVGLINHPQDGLGDPEKIFAVEKNPRIIEDWLCVDITLVGPHGQLCESILQAGGPLEFSSSCLGDVDYSGYVLEEGFDVERWADRVFGPSNGLSLFMEDSKREEKKEEIKVLHEEEIEKEDIKKEKENLTILKEEEKNGDKIMVDKLVEKSVALNIKGMLKEVKDAKTFAEKKEILEFALDSAKELTDKTLQEQIEKELVTVDKEVHELAEKGKDIESIKKDATTLQETINTVTKEKEEVAKAMENVKKEKEEIDASYKTLVEMYENKQYQAGEETLKTNKELNKLIKILKNKITVLQEKAKYFEALSNTKVEADVVVALNEKVERTKIKNKILEKRLEISKKDKLVEFKNPEVKEYYEELLEKDNSIKEFEEQFKDCTSLREAQIIRMYRKKEDKKEVRKGGEKIEETTEKEKSRNDKQSAWDKQFKERGWK
jgi:hypothetical protein